MRLLAITALWLAGPALAAQDLDLHWRFEAQSLAGGLMKPEKGELALKPSGEVRFVGEGATQAMAMAPGAPLLAVEGGMDASSLPDRRLTVEAWVAVDQVAPWGGILGAITDNGDHERGWVLGHKGSRFVFGVATDDVGRLSYLEAPKDLLVGRWYHLAGVYDGRSLTLYVDGEPVAETEECGGKIIYDARQELVAGSFKDSNENHPLVGALYEVRLSSRAVSSHEFYGRHRAMAEAMPAPEPGRRISGIEVKTGPTLREMQPAISAAIDKGTAWLISRQHRDGSWESHQDPYPAGMTSLATYTLLKQGIPPSHPSIQRALSYLRRHTPKKTYSAGCLLLALSATEDESHADWAEEIVDLLVSWESKNPEGSYAYPHGAIDLSCTQYAALGLWAASKLGVDAPRDLWQRLVEQSCELYLQDPVEVDWDEGNQGRSGTRKIAGFSYRPKGTNSKPTGSMTTAGLCVIGTARDVLGSSLGRKAGRAAERAERLAVDWLDHHWSVTGNPGVGGGRYLYYLYGVERVGALFETDVIGKHEWYRGGAAELIKRQKGEGTWGNEEGTCFALLFLSRATSSATGPGLSSAKPAAWETREGDVFFRATGTGDLAMWITGFGEQLLEGVGLDSDERKGLRVARVEYLLNGKVVAEVDGDTARLWESERFPARYSVKTLGKHTLQARVHLSSYDGGSDITVVESKPLAIEAKLTTEQLMERTSLPEGLVPLPFDAVELTASSAQDAAADKSYWVGKATDGREASRWLATPQDAEPWMRFQLRDVARVDALSLTPPASAIHLAGHFESPRKARVIIDGREEYEVEFPDDGLSPALLEFEKTQKIRRVEIHLLERTDVGKKRTGLSEVTLLGRESRSRRRR